MLRYGFDGKLNEDMLFGTPLEGTCTGEAFSQNMTTNQKKMDCLGVSASVCVHSAGAMLGKKNGLKARVLQVAPHVKFTHCIIHREALASKTLDA